MSSSRPQALQSDGKTQMMTDLQILKTFSQPLSYFFFIPIDYKDAWTKQYVDIQILHPCVIVPLKPWALICC